MSRNYEFIPRHTFSQPHLASGAVDHHHQPDINPPNINPSDRIFLHNPLHDYESVWWMAVWFVFNCKLEGEDDNDLKRARDNTYRSRELAVVGSNFTKTCDNLPQAIQPLGSQLVQMRNKLIAAYRSFETSFNGSNMLQTAHDLKICLKDLREKARNVNATVPKTHTKRVRDDREGVEATEVQRTGKGSGRVGGF